MQPTCPLPVPEAASSKEPTERKPLEGPFASYPTAG